MIDDIITRTVVGGPMTLTVGEPVGQQFHTSRAATALRWKDGQWASPAALSSVSLPRFWRLARPKTFSLSTASPRPGALKVRAAAGILVLALLGVGAGAGLLLRHNVEGAAALPIAPAAGLAAVKVVSAAYEPTTTVQAPSADRPDSSPLPIATATPRTEPAAPLGSPIPLAAPLPAAVPAPAIPATAKAGAAKPSPAPGTEQPQKVPAVVLDEAAPTAAKAVAPTNTAAAKPQPTAAKAEPAKALPAPAAAAPARGAGLVAITPDGKFALFTNPKTRLPEQFKVGDQLPGGDTVRAIDHKEGKVLTSAKEYHLD